MIQFNFVYSQDAVQVKNFLDGVPRNVDCINYIEIVNKLTRNDFYQEEPSDAVVSSYLMKSLQSSIEGNQDAKLYYVIGELDSEVINGIKAFVDQITSTEVRWNIYHFEDIDQIVMPDHISTFNLIS
jgi:hypothetical protein